MLMRYEESVVKSLEQIVQQHDHVLAIKFKYHKINHHIMSWKDMNAVNIGTYHMALITSMEGHKYNIIANTMQYVLIGMVGWAINQNAYLVMQSDLWVAPSSMQYVYDGFMVTIIHKHIPQQINRVCNNNSFQRPASIQRCIVPI